MPYSLPRLCRALGASALALLAFAPHPAFAQTNTWIAPADGDWSLAGNWSLGLVPDGTGGSYDDVLNSSAFTITHSASTGPGGVDIIHSYQNTGPGGLMLTGGVLAGSLANQGSTFQSTGTLLNGGTLRNFTLVNSDALAFSNTVSSNTLDNVKLDGGLTLNGGLLNIKNGLTYANGATFHLGSAGSLNFDSNYTFANATLDFGTTFSTAKLGVDSSHTLTLDSTLKVIGADANLVGGPMVNNTLLSSNLGGLWSLTPAISLTNNGTIEARNTGSTMSISGGSLTNNGVIQAVGGSAPGVSVQISVGTLTNLGTIQATSDGTYPGGQVSLSAFNYAALGTITATGAGSAVVIGNGDPNSNISITLGSGDHLSASGGGAIFLATTLDNTGKTFDPDSVGVPGSFVLSHGRILNGTIAHSDDLTFDNSGLTPNILENVTLSGGLDLTRRGNLGEAEIQGTFQYGSNAVFNIGSGGGELDFVGNHTLDNATVKISGGTLGISGGTLTLGPNLVIQGSGGTIGRDNFAQSPFGSLVNDTTILSSNNFWNIQGKTVVNNGTIGATNGGFTSLIGNVSLTNTGTITVDATSSMTMDTFTQTGGHTDVQGTLSLLAPPNAPFGQAGIMTLQGGDLSGTGIVAGSVTNTGGVVRPGLGTLTIQSNGFGGDYLQGSGGTLLEDLGGGPAGGLFGVLAVSGNAGLDGTLDIGFLNGYAPKVGDKFTFLTYGSETGAFADILSAPGYGFSVTYLPTEAILTVNSVPAAVPEASTAAGFSALLALGGLTLRRRRRGSA